LRGMLSTLRSHGCAERRVERMVLRPKLPSTAAS
jgi:hypothetical protein